MHEFFLSPQSRFDEQKSTLNVAIVIVCVGGDGSQSLSEFLAEFIHDLHVSFQSTQKLGRESFCSRGWHGCAMKKKETLPVCLDVCDGKKRLFLLRDKSERKTTD